MTCVIPHGWLCVFQTRLRLLYPEMLENGRVAPAGALAEDYTGEIHQDTEDVHTTALGTRDFGGCGECKLVQHLCFPCQGVAVPIRDREVLLFDGANFSHGASTIQKISRKIALCL